jgi:hypothetical protein
LRDEHELVPALGRLDHLVGVLDEARRRVATRQINGDRRVTGGLQLGHDAMPKPPGPAGAGNQEKGAHGM